MWARTDGRHVLELGDQFTERADTELEVVQARPGGIGPDQAVDAEQCENLTAVRGVMHTEEAQSDVDRSLGHPRGTRWGVGIGGPLVERAVSQYVRVEGGHVVVAAGLEHEFGYLQRDGLGLGGRGGGRALGVVVIVRDSLPVRRWGAAASRCGA